MGDESMAARSLWSVEFVVFPPFSSSLCFGLIWPGSSVHLASRSIVDDLAYA